MDEERSEVLKAEEVDEMQVSGIKIDCKNKKIKNKTQYLSNFSYECDVYTRWLNVVEDGFDGARGGGGGVV